MAATYDAIERNKKPAGALEIPENFHFYYLNKQDRQMRFNNGGDPIYAVFDKIDNRPLSKIAKDFVKELKDDSIRFISTLLNQYVGSKLVVFSQTPTFTPYPILHLTKFCPISGLFLILTVNSSFYIFMRQC